MPDTPPHPPHAPTDRPRDAQPEIYCPRCAYRPQPEDRWDCLPRCATSFHTFWTRATCPACGIQWPKTQCPACGELSPHSQWYHQPQQDPAAETEKPLELVNI